MDIIEAIRTRRSIRKYRTEPVDDEKIRLVLEAASQAPSWANTQCWRFIVVRDSNIKNRLAGTLVAVSDSPNRSAEALRAAPVVIVACAELGKSGYYAREPREPATDKGDWYMFDVALAMQNLQLAAHSLGLGTVHIGAFNAKQVAGIMEVPQGITVVEMTPLGYPDEEPLPRVRKDLSEIVFYDRYGTK